MQFSWQQKGSGVRQLQPHAQILARQFHQELQTLEGTQEEEIAGESSTVSVRVKAERRVLMSVEEQ